jgi:hypothetical protein
LRKRAFWGVLEKGAVFGGKLEKEAVQGVA